MTKSFIQISYVKMSQNTNFFTFIWKIQNCSFFWPNQVQSPPFLLQGMGQTKWYLHICFKSNIFKDSIAYLHREHGDVGGDLYKLNYELSFLMADGSTLYSKKYFQKDFTMFTCDSEALTLKRDEVLMQKSLYIPDDTLTIRCRIWDRRKPFLQSGTCTAETSLETECTTFVGIFRKFSCLKANCKYIVDNNSAFFSSMHLSVTTDGKLVIEIKPIDVKSTDMHRFEIFILDIYGNAMNSGHGNFKDRKTHSIPLTVSKERIIQNKGIYLPNDVLTLQCHVIFLAGKIIEKAGNPEYGFDCEENTQNVSCKTKLNLCSEEDNLENLKTLKDDFTSVLKEGILCDAKLKTATETFPVHAIVLSARSPVFKSMFTTDMKEKINKCVNIDDLDADTVRRMLLFMYSASLDDLQYENAKSLYFAADKYNIVSLKQKCSHFLKLNLQQTNCCDVLALADQHQDASLKNTVQDYIAENDMVVLFSDEWKNLEKTHSQLTTEVLRFIYLKNRKN